jgi:nicotinamide-nucleotide amidase
VYATDLKATLVGVPREVLDAHGAVSPQTARALAEGIRDRCAATWGVGLTGVAGPDPADGHAPGRVYLGVSGPAGSDVVRLDLPGDRAAVRRGAVDAAVAALLDRVQQGKPGPAAGVTP